jgi:hypothetical protein
MGLFTDLFSTKPAEQAAADKKAGLAQGYDALSGQFQQGRDVLDTNLGQGRTALASNIGQGNDAINAGYGAGRDAINAGYSDASALYKPLVASTTLGANAYGDATGVNGAEGIARGGSVFKSLPGYSGGLTTGIDAVDRGAAARGALGGGNTSADIIKFASDYDANKYGSYVSSLAPYLSANANAISGAAGLGVGRGAALNANEVGRGTALNGNFGTLGTGLNANFGALGGGLNASYEGQGGAANANFTGQGNAQAQADLAPYSASQNFWSGLMGGANALAKVYGGGGSSLFGGSPSGSGSTGDGSWYGPSSVGGKPLS